MLKNYTGKFGTIIDSTGKSIAVVGMVLFNDSTVTRTAQLFLRDSAGNIKAQLLETSLKSKESMFIDSKIFVSDGDTITGEGVTFTLSGNEDTL